MESTTRSVGTEANQEGLGIEAHREQLFRGIPDHLTLREIAVKLPWKSLCSLAPVNRAWLCATRNREVYDERVFYRALESLVLLRYYGKGTSDTLALYSTRDGLYLELPPLRVCEQGIPTDTECIALDGKIFAMGGRKLDFYHVYALDLVGPKRQWKQCASMLRQSIGFRCAPLDGKIYALWGVHDDAIGSEFSNPGESAVYDPREDTWSLIAPMPRPFSYIWRGAVGEELVVLSSQDTDPVFKYTVDVYHPVKDEWRAIRVLPVKGYWWGNLENLFTSKGKLYSMLYGCIFVLDMDTPRWMLRHHYSFAGPLGWLVNDEEFSGDTYITGVGDELLLIVGSWDGQMFIFESEGFGGKNIDIVWHDCTHHPSNTSGFPVDMYPIEL